MKNWPRSLFIGVGSLSLVFAAACAEIRVNTIPAPPPAAKLRVCIQVLTSSENVYWQVPHIVHEQNTIRGTTKMLQEKGRLTGTTMRGLQIHHQIDTDDYLAYVHDLPLHDYLYPNPQLRSLLTSLPQRRWIFTNADADYILIGRRTCSGAHCS